MKAYKHLVKHAIANDLIISVWDGEEWQVKYSNKYKEIIDAIESVDEAEIKIRTRQDKKVVGWALVSAAYGLEDDETVIDHTCTSFMEDWWLQYENS